MKKYNGYAKKQRKEKRKQLSKEWYLWKKQTMFFMTVNSTPIQIVRRTTVALNLPRSVDKLIVRGTEIVAAVTASSWLPTPSPTMLAITTAISNLQTKQNLAKQRTIGAVADRDTAKTTLIDLLRNLRLHVQGVCNLNPTNAETIALSALMYIKKMPIRQKNKMKVKQLTSGCCELIGTSSSGVKSHDWGQSLDPSDPLSWNVAPIASTSKDKVKLAGLRPGTHYYFRHRCLLLSGYTDWEYADQIIL